MVFHYGRYSEHVIYGMHSDTRVLRMLPELVVFYSFLSYMLLQCRFCKFYISLLI
ncbi:unnamed protein product [Enterobius vermicularis]|uniref:Ovule protein n=1 Tax=Enterobius vermicularis TaxID=51028 RepID=A0A0N4VMU1_ENTVE|nr:unnamed protein product [Enterobius vermicularis]